MKTICYIRKRKSYRWATFILLTFLFVFCMLGVKPLTDLIWLKIKRAQSYYAIVFDARLSVSHMYLYSFHRAYPDNRVILNNEHHINMTPGIFKLDEKTNNITVFISALGYFIDLASAVIPKRKRSQTPVLLRGISDIPQCAEVSLMNEEYRAMDLVRRFLEITEFQIQPGYIGKQNSYEAEMNVWTAITILKGEKTALITLGHENMHVMYKTTTVEGKFINNIDRFWDSHMLTGFGLSYARVSTLSYRYDDDRENVLSACFNPRVTNVPWTLETNERKLIVSGISRNTPHTEEENTFVDKEVCISTLKSLINSEKNFLLSRYFQDDEIEINVRGFFFRRAVEAGLILAHSRDTQKVTVKEFVNASNVECARVNFVKPWLCLDLTYISLLLSDVLKLASDRALTLSKYSDGHRLSWPLGLAGNTWEEIFMEKGNASVVKEY